MQIAMRQVLLSLLVTVLYSPIALAAGEAITGAWVTYDDESGQKKSVVTISEANGALTGHVTEVFVWDSDERNCVKCEGEKHNQPVVGLEIFNGLTLDGEVWRGGTILDPKNGKEYACELRMEGNELKVRGYLLMFYRTQTWKRL